jgi:hypothetical protein
MTTIARTLPVSLPPVHHELLGSYLHRLADANHLTIHDLSREIGPGRYHRRDSDDTAGWTPRAVTRLAALTGTWHHGAAMPLTVKSTTLNSRRGLDTWRLGDLELGRVPFRRGRQILRTGPDALRSPAG